MSTTLAAALWLTLRLGALLLVQVPWLRLIGPLWIPIAAVLALSLSLSLALSLSLPPAASLVDTPTLVRGAIFELLFGGLAGLLLGAPGHALLGAAGASGRALELRRGAWEPLLITLVLCLCLGLGLHRPLLLGLREFALLAPPGAGLQEATGLLLHGLRPTVLAGAAAHLLFLSLALATPVLLSKAVVELAAGLIEPPGEPRPGTGRWLAAAAALLALCASWSAYPQAWLRSLEPAEISQSAD